MSSSTLNYNSSTVPPPSNLTITVTVLGYPAENSTERDFSMCAADDCYNEHQYEAMHESYIPMSKTAVYVMLAIYLFLAVIAIPILWRVPFLPRKSKNGEYWFNACLDDKYIQIFPFTVKFTTILYLYISVKKIDTGRVFTRKVVFSCFVPHIS